MRLALFYNSLDNIGGAEEVTLQLARQMKADVFTTNIDPDMVRKMGFADVLPRMYSIGKVPKSSPFRQQLILWRFSRLNVSHAYDGFLITGDWAVSAARNHPGAAWYAHGPLNELWQFKGVIASSMLPAWKRPIFFAWAAFNRMLTKRYARRIGPVAANSKGTVGRVLERYGLESSVTHPPVDTARFSRGKARGYWLSVNRFVRHKKIEDQLDAFRAMPDKKLIIVASYEKGAIQFEDYKRELESLRPQNVEFRHWVGESELASLYSEAVGVIATSPEEDFGMTAIEAMASGKPFVAPDTGGYTESVIHGKTGILYPRGGLKDAVVLVEEMLSVNPDTFADASIKRAADFDVSNFSQKIRAIFPSVADDSGRPNFAVSEPLVSVIVPVRNGKERLSDFVASIATQTYENFELVLVDNTKEGDLADLIKLEALLDASKIKIVREPLPGRGRARRKGELASSGELVLMTDIDCLPDPSWVETMAAPIIEGKADAVQGTEHGLIPGYWSDQKTRQAKEKHDAAAGTDRVQGFVDTKNFAITRYMLERAGFTNAAYKSGNDTSLSMELSCLARRIPFVLAFSKDSDIGHVNPSTAYEVVRKQIVRGFWTARISRDYAHAIDKKFLKDSGQSSSFFRIPRIREGVWYDIIAGFAWRVGLILGQVRAWLYN
ncbi:MAG TPA: glycosyltransferase [Candidatus Paceibacterota bacterium]